MNATNAVIEPICHEQHAAGVPQCRNGMIELCQGATGAVRKAHHPTARQGAHYPSGERKGTNAVATLLLHHVAHSAIGIQGNISGAIKLRSHTNAIGPASSATPRKGGDQARGQHFAHTVVGGVCHVHVSLRI